MWATSNGPRIEDFGITEDDLARTPELFFARHRPGFVVSTYVISAAALFLVLLQLGSSWPAAVFFSIVALAAVSVLLLPLIAVALCVCERAEVRWLCHRVPAVRSCLAYRAAVYDRGNQTYCGPSPAILKPSDWKHLSRSAFLAQIELGLDQTTSARVFSHDRESTGIDFSLEWPDRRVILRCEPGSGPVSAGVGRELSAALTDFEADAAFVLAVSDPDPALARYITERSIFMVAPWDMEASLLESGSSPGVDSGR